MCVYISDTARKDCYLQVNSDAWLILSASTGARPNTISLDHREDNSLPIDQTTGLQLISIVRMTKDIGLLRTRRKSILRQIKSSCCYIQKETGDFVRRNVRLFVDHAVCEINLSNIWSIAASIPDMSRFTQRHIDEWFTVGFIGYTLSWTIIEKNQLDYKY